MKQILLLFFSFFILTFLQAQVTIKLVPAEIELDVDKTQFETVAHSWMTNTSDTIKTFRWFREVVSITDGWESAICDVNACYSIETNSTPDEFLLELAPGDTSMLDVHIRPGGLEGAAVIKVVIQEVNNPENQVEGTYLFNQTTPTKEFSRQAVKLFPNPAENYFQLTESADVDHLVIYNLTGRQMKEFIAYPNEKFIISELQRGLYLVRLLDRRNHVLKTLRLNKR